MLMGFVVLSWALFIAKAGGEGLLGKWPNEPVEFNEVTLLLEGLNGYQVFSEPRKKEIEPKAQLPRRPRSLWPKPASLNLNKVDSAQLEGLPRLGPVLAARICKFRESLGGYHSTDQLKEIWGLQPEVAEEVIPWFHLGDGVFRFLCADTASWSNLRAHPYIGTEGARAIERYRRYHPLDSINALRNAIPITDSLIRRWSPYLRICEPIVPSP